MKKRYVLSALGLGAAGYLLSKRNSQNQHEELGEDRTLYNAGKPDQLDEYELDQIENAKMVSEGSQFGVQYYNNLKEDE
ncbi:hypothetical protein [Ornithinibacillus halotolerans]|uniref:hypothetical protein n=1 Tax=Ornithinibacillus halotolerans TaxID=1274357 RepID=UPI00166AEABA|nr:hypothetical protein [Ornithinibacillus halotolerans]